jgi:hypothetical protein
MVDSSEETPATTTTCRCNHSLEGLNGYVLGAILSSNNHTGQGLGIYRFGSRINDGGAKYVAKFIELSRFAFYLVST